MSDAPISGDFKDFATFCHREDPVYPKGKNGKFRCPCCMHFTLGSIAAYDICPICFWEDDGTTSEHGFSPNGISLTEGQENYKKFGASKEHDRQYVRPAEPHETE